MKTGQTPYGHRGPQGLHGISVGRPYRLVHSICDGTGVSESNRDQSEDPLLCAMEVHQNPWGECQ